MANVLGLVAGFLKSIGKAALPLAEDAGIAAANAALPGIGGTLAQIAIQGITAAVSKHPGLPNSALVTAPASTVPGPVAPVITVGDSKKLDVLALIESKAPDVVNMILAGRQKAVVDRAKFVEGTSELVDGLHKIMQSIGAVPTSAPAVDPVVVSKAPDGGITVVPVVPVPAAQDGGTLSVNADQLVPLLQQLLARLTK